MQREGIDTRGVARDVHRVFVYSPDPCKVQYTYV
jgi:hypothetical protein